MVDKEIITVLGLQVGLNGVDQLLLQFQINDILKRQDLGRFQVYLLLFRISVELIQSHSSLL